MASCKLIAEIAAKELKDYEVVDGKGFVKNKEGFYIISRAVGDQVLAFYGKDIANPIGEILPNGKLKANGELRALEASLKKKATDRYGAIHTGTNEVEAGISVVLDKPFLNKLIVSDSNSLELKVLYENGDVEWVSYSGIKKHLKPGMVNFMEDIMDSQNISLLRAHMAGFVAPILDRVITGNNIKDELISRAVEENPKDIFEDMVDTSLNEGSRVINKYFDDFLSANDIEVEVVIAETVNKSSAGTAAANLITMSPFAMGYLTDSRAEAMNFGASVYVHEKAHVVTVGLLANDKDYNRKMTELYNYALTKIGSKPYGMTNVAEFVAEAFTNEDFQLLLNGIPSPNKQETLYQSLVNFLAEALENVLGVTIDNSVLEDILAITVESASKATQNRLNLYDLSTGTKEITDNTSSSGVYEGNDLNKARKWASSVGLGLDTPTRQFVTNSIKRTPMDKSSILMHINFDRNNDYFAKRYGGHSISELTDHMGEVKNIPVSNFSGTPPLSVNAVNGDIEVLKKLNSRLSGKVTLPIDTEDGKYAIASIPHYRATSYLGFGIESDKYNLLENANKIGNTIDELGKRVFTEGYGPEALSYEAVSDFVKEENWARIKNAPIDYQAIEEGLEQGITTRKEFNDQYSNPVSEKSFYELQESLFKMKEKLINEHGVVKFHPDLVVWDNKKIVAGEIDILAEHADGSFTVIDLKTRRAGLSGSSVDNDYEASQEEEYNTRTKHRRQTSLYSLMLRNMGFEVNGPMIIMGQPVYESESIENDFIDIIPGEKLILIPLELEENVFDFVLDGGFKRKVRDKINTKRLDYEAWFKEQHQTWDKVSGTHVTENREEQVLRLQKGLLSIKYKLEEYTNLLKKGEYGGAISSDLAGVAKKIETQLNKEIESTTVLEQLNVMDDFFVYAREQLAQLVRAFDQDEANRRDAYFKILDYRGIAKLGKQLAIELEQVNNEGGILEEDYERVKGSYAEFAALDSGLEVTLTARVRELAKQVLIDNFLGSKAEIIARDEMYKSMPNATEEEKQIYINEKRRDKDYLEELKKDYDKEIDELINSTHFDMSEAAFLLNSDTEVNNPFVQYMQKILSIAQLDFAEVANEKIIDLAKVQKRLGLTKKEMKQMVYRAEDGFSYLQGEYKIEFMDEYTVLQEAVWDAINMEDRKLAIIAKKKATAELNAWKLENTEIDPVTFRRSPTATWKNPALSKLNSRQMEALNYFKEVTEASYNTIGKKSLIASAAYPNIQYHRLPGIKQTVFGAAMEGNFIKTAKILFKEQTKLEKDDIEYGFSNDDNTKHEMFLGLDGTEVYKPPVHYRGNLGEKQNLDLFTVYALETQNYLKYDIAREASMKGTILIDMVNSKEFHKTLGGRKKIVNIARAKGSPETSTISGDASVVSKMLLKMMKNNVYSMSKEYVELQGYDVHKISQFVSSYTAFATMSFKVLSATNNWVTGHVNNAIEAAGGEFYNTRNMINARAYYNRNIMGILADIEAPVKKNIVNQLLIRFDIQNEGNILNNEFEKTNIVTRLLHPGTTLGGYQMGEHSIQANVMLSALDAIKVLNADGKFINKDGKVVAKRSEAMSMLNAYQINEDGVVEINLPDGGMFTEFEEYATIKGTGEAAIKDLIKDRITRTQGAFDSLTKANINRLWWGGLTMQFKKHILPQGLNRWRGLGSVLKATDDIVDTDKYYNFRAKTEEYGYYVTFLRNLISVVKQEKFNILNYKKAGSDNWKKMSKHERSNMKKTIAELTFTTFALLMAGMAAAAADDDDEELWAMYYILKRQGKDLSQYWNFTEAWRVTESPMAAIKHVSNLTSALQQIWAPNEEFTSGTNAGRNKLARKTQKLLMLDRLDQFKGGYNKRLYDGLDKY